MLRLDLKKIRKDLNLTQRKIADIFGVPQSFISQIENGKDPMPAHWIAELKRMLNIPDLSAYQLSATPNEEDSVLIRLKSFFDSTELPISRIALQLGLTQRMVVNILKGDAKIDLGVLLSVVAGFPSLNLNWLMTGNGDMLLKSTPIDIDRITTLVDTIASLQETINTKSETIDILTKHIQQLENQLQLTKL